MKNYRVSQGQPILGQLVRETRPGQQNQFEFGLYRAQTTAHNRARPGLRPPFRLTRLAKQIGHFRAQSLVLAQHRLSASLIVILPIAHVPHHVGNLIVRENLQRVSLERVAQPVLRFAGVQVGAF